MKTERKECCVKLRLFVLAIVSTLLLSSCDMIVRSENGDLDGMWYLTSIDSISNSTSIDTHGQRRTWSFQHKLVQYFNYDENNWTKTIMGRFDLKDDMLILRDPFVYNRMDGDYFLDQDSIELLYPYGINSIPDTFIIDKLNRKELNVTSNIVRLHFIRF